MEKIREKYDIEHGFLTLCNEKLPEKYAELVYIANNLPDLIKSKSLRKDVDDLPEYKMYDLSDKQVKLLYKYCVMIINSYIWCDAEPKTIIPTNLSIIAWQVSNKLGLVPILTHAAVDLYNWNFINEYTDDKFDVKNIKIVNTITGLKTEEWFYTIMISIEGYGNDIINNIIKMSCDIDDDKIIKSCLIDIHKTQKKISNVILHMYDHCNPHEFYNILRIYLNGSIDEKLFPYGLKYSGVIDNCKFRGGSAAQSTLIYLLDTIFGINKQNEELKDLRKFMPIKHVEFIEYIQNKFSNFTELIKKYDLIEEFNNCIDELTKFRLNHMKLIKTHIVAQSNKIDETGSAGTSLGKFLNPIIEETKNAKL